MQSGPAAAGGAPTAQGGPPRVGRLAVAASFTAVVLSLVAVALSAGALSRTRDRVDAAPPATAAPAAPSAGQSTAPPATSTITPSDTSSSGPAGEVVPTLDQEPQARFTDHGLRIQPNVGCSSQRTVDVDEPRVGADPDESEFIYGNCATDVPQLDFSSDLAIAEVVSPTATALDCLGQLQDAPINEPFTPRAGQTLCLVTSRADADEQAITRKVVRIAIGSIDGNGTLAVRVTAWDLPK
jgi:hypothetical protein